MSSSEVIPEGNDGGPAPARSLTSKSAPRVGPIYTNQRCSKSVVLHCTDSRKWVGTLAPLCPEEGQLLTTMINRASRCASSILNAIAARRDANAGMANNHRNGADGSAAGHLLAWPSRLRREQISQPR